jgi:simple sugar transport system ATP-binding protein
MRDAVLQLKGIAKCYGAVRALENVDLEVHRGEVVALVGDNGAGKSTVVKIVSGALRPDEGTLLLDGAERRWESPRGAQAAGIETVYQDAGLAPHLSVSANLFLGRELRRSGIAGRLRLLDGPSMRRRARDELARLGIRIPGGDARVSRLSGGQRQAVAIGRAVVWARKVVLLDEPTNHLGVEEQEEVLGLIAELKQRGLAVVLISHTLPHVLRAADRVVTLRLGRVVSSRTAGSTTVDELVRDITGSAGAHDGAVGPPTASARHHLRMTLTDDRKGI